MFGCLLSQGLRMFTEQQQCLLSERRDSRNDDIRGDSSNEVITSARQLAIVTVEPIRSQVESQTLSLHPRSWSSCWFPTSAPRGEEIFSSSSRIDEMADPRSQIAGRWCLLTAHSGLLMIMLRLPRDRDMVSADRICGWMFFPARDAHQSQIKKDHSAVRWSLCDRRTPSGGRSMQIPGPFFLALASSFSHLINCRCNF